MDVEVWSDVVCPWCRIGRAHLAQALARFPHADDVRVIYRSFELDPSAPGVRDDSIVDQLTRKYGMDAAQVQAMLDTVSERGADVGLEFRFDQARSGSTFDAHRLLHLARQTGQQDALQDRLMAAHFVEGRALGDPGELAEVAVAAGLDPAAVASVLESDAFADAVRQDEHQARTLGVTGVPFFVIDRRLGVSGAQPADVLLSALEQAWALSASTA